MSEKRNGGGGVDPGLVRELAAILSESGLTEIEVEHGELKLRLARTVTYAAPAPAAPMVMHAAPVAAAAPAATEAPADLRNHPGAVNSPMVGTAYLSPEPGAAVFIKVGDNVTEGQTLLIVEAMKTFNPIPAPKAGRVSSIRVTDGQPVEFGQVLVILE
jgi:acetyl-CoA carboxylase biotin carboxyl carrier protein